MVFDDDDRNPYEFIYVLRGLTKSRFQAQKQMRNRHIEYVEKQQGNSFTWQSSSSY